MKAIITLKDGRIFSGTLESVYGNRICVEIEKLSYDEVVAMQEENLVVHQLIDKTWFVIAYFNHIEGFDLVN